LLGQIQKFEPSKAVEACDLLFLALPHGASCETIPQLLKRRVLPIIDLGNDYRLDPRAVYGLTELNRSQVQQAGLLANPGCYPTATLLGLAPLAELKRIGAGPVIVDAKSGVSGAGKSVEKAMAVFKKQGNLQPYKVDQHQHVPEMEKAAWQLAGRKITLTFVPHLIPIDQGLISTLYIPLKPKMTTAKLHAVYKKRYAKEPFVRVLPAGSWPQLSAVVNTNFCDIGVQVSQTGQHAIVVSAIDNLIKGAAGQAIQNMNRMCGFKETEGLL